jgi:hypothetical protein
MQTKCILKTVLLKSGSEHNDSFVKKSLLLRRYTRIMLASMMDEEEGKTVDSDWSTEDEGEEGDVVGRKKK